MPSLGTMGDFRGANDAWSSLESIETDESYTAISDEVRVTIPTNLSPL